MRIQDITDERLDEGPIWDKVKAGAKKIFSPAKFTPAKKDDPLVQSKGDIKRIFKKILNKEQLDQRDTTLINTLYRQI